MITNVNHVVYNFFFLTNVHYVIGQHDPHLTKTFTSIDKGKAITIIEKC